MESVLNNKVKIYRTIANLSQVELAEKVEVTRQTIIAIENNNHMPSILLCLKIAKALNTDLNTLFYLH